MKPVSVIMLFIRNQYHAQLKDQKQIHYVAIITLVVMMSESNDKNQR